MPEPTGPTGLLTLYAEWCGLEVDLANERRRAERWQKLAGHYDDIRYALRNCDDTPEGHAEFYRQCAELIFPEGKCDDGSDDA